MKSQSATRSLLLCSATVKIKPDIPAHADGAKTLVSNGRTDVFGRNGRQDPGAGARLRPDYEGVSSTNRLSSREKDVLHWLVRGKSGPEIGIILGISTCTVRIHIQNLKRKMNAVNIPHAVYQAFALGILRL